MKIRRTVSGRLTLVAAVGALAVAGLVGVVASGLAAGASPVAGNAVAAMAPTWKMQTPPEPAGTTNQAFGAVSCSSSSACLAIAINDYPRGFGEFAETWNGSHWTVRTVPDGKTADDLQGVQCRSAQWCVAVGSKASGNDFVPVADRWNGSAWTQTNPPAPAGATNSDLAAVACSGTTACTAIGESAKGTARPDPAGRALERLGVEDPAGSRAGGRRPAERRRLPHGQRLPRGGQRQQGPVLRGLERLVVGDPAGPGAGRRVVRGAERHLLHGG